MDEKITTQYLKTINPNVAVCFAASRANGQCVHVVCFCFVFSLRLISSPLSSPSKCDVASCVRQHYLMRLWIARCETVRVQCTIHTATHIPYSAFREHIAFYILIQCRICGRKIYPEPVNVRHRHQIGKDNLFFFYFPFF